MFLKVVAKIGGVFPTEGIVRYGVEELGAVGGHAFYGIC